MKLASRRRLPSQPTLAAAYARGAKAHPGVTLSVGDYAAALPDGVVPRADADYYIARACETGADGAWERLEARYSRPLRAFLRRQGASASEAAQLIDESWGVLATPPPRGNARTRLGTYDGRGALHAWLATILWRRLTELWRRRTPAAAAAETESASGPAHRDPAISVSQEETGRLLSRALEKAWSGLTQRELQAVVLKYGHRMPQVEVARVLRVSAPRVTRMLQSATTRLREAITAQFDRASDWEVGGGGWAGLAATVERMLSRTAAEIELPAPGRSADG